MQGNALFPTLDPRPGLPPWYVPHNCHRRAMAVPEFVHLHVHTDYSLLDGACRIDRLTQRIQALGMKACAMTDHGNLFGAIDFYTAMKGAGIKPILGCEVYLVEGSRLDQSPPRDGEKGYYHLGLLARNAEGYANLLKLVSDAHLRGFYYKPRCDFESLAQHARGLIGLSGCLAGLIPQHLLAGRWTEACRATERFIGIFGRDAFFIEVQDHGMPEQARIRGQLLRLAREFGLRAVASNDVHYLTREDARPHETMLCIQTGKRLKDEGRMQFNAPAFYLKTQAEMAQLFPDSPELLANTLLVAEMCELQLRFGENHYPVFPLPPEAGSDRTAYLRRLCESGLRRRYGIDTAALAAHPNPAYARSLVERMDYELGIIAKTGFVDYFLIVQDFIAWAKGQGIPVGPGRGSGAGCLVAYLLGITDIDPIRFGLLFERFLNPERVSPPDFDIDFCMRRRGEVVDYVRDKYGRENVVNIITFGTLRAKAVIRDVARAHDLSFAETNRLASLVPDELHIDLATALERSAELRQEVETNPIAARIVEEARSLEGMVRNSGKHAAGIIIADRPISEFVPLTMQEGDVTTQFAMDPVQKLGLLKMDFLGLKTLTILDDAVRAIRATVKPDFDLDTIPLDDPRTFQLINSGRTTAVFQLESVGMQTLCRQFGVSSIDEIIALIALYRPGPMDLIPEYIRGKKDPSAITYPHPLLEDVCRETYGIMVYQEQVMEAAKRIAGYSLGAADVLRRAMGKKKPEEMEKQRAVFVAGAAKHNGIDERRALEIFALLEKFAGYGFNKSHSAAYGLLCYRTAYLKAHFPVQFMAAVLTCEQGNADSVKHFISECTALGIRVLGPDINVSGAAFTAVPDPQDVGRGAIRFGLASVKGVGELAAERILEARRNGGPFSSLLDLVSRVDTRAVNKRVLENLIRTGAFDSIEPGRSSLLGRVDDALAAAQAMQRDRDSGQHSFLDLIETPASRWQPARPSSAQDIRLEEILRYERELLGVYLTGHPLDQFAGLAEAASTTTPDRVLDLPDRTVFRMAGLVSSIERRLSRKDDRPWAQFRFSTREGGLELSLFGDGFAEYGSALAEEAPVLVTGRVSERNGEKRVLVEKVQPLAAALPTVVRRVTFVVRVVPEAETFLEELRSHIDHHRGSIACCVAFPLKDGLAAAADLPSSLHLALPPAQLARLRSQPAVEGVLVECRPPELEERRRRPENWVS